MNNVPTSIDFIAAGIALIILVVSMLTLLGMGLLMAIGAVFSNRPLVTSWPTEQEHTFDAFERRGSLANSQAWVVSLVGAMVVTFVATGIYFGVAPEKRDMTKDMNMSNLTKKRPPLPPKAEAAPPAEAPKADTPAPEAPKPASP